MPAGFAEAVNLKLVLASLYQVFDLVYQLLKPIVIDDAFEDAFLNAFTVGLHQLRNFLKAAVVRNVIGDQYEVTRHLSAPTFLKERLWGDEPKFGPTIPSSWLRARNLE